jgi:hypothetical protein
MLASQALQQLSTNLASAIGSLGLSNPFGKIDLVASACQQAEELFQGYAKAKPSHEDAYAAARALLRGEALDAWKLDLVASAICDPIREQAGATVIASSRLPELLACYEDEASRGELWRLTWHGLLYSYFKFDPLIMKDDPSRDGWRALQQFLERSWPLINRQSGDQLIPDWIAVLRAQTQILSEQPVGPYVKAYLDGDSSLTDQLASDLGIPPASWFWHALVLGCVKRATGEPDAAFKQRIPRLLQLIHDKPMFRDEAIESLLIRYHACKGAMPDLALSQYVCQPSVWKNPKLKAAGIATAWNRVPEAVWQMVLGWVNERNLKDFFDILAARNSADEGRLAFWSKYLKQITWTRLVFGHDTMALKRTNPAVRDLIAREEGAYAQLTEKRDVDAFMMRIGNHLIIEFSKKPNACYVYDANGLPFELHSRYFGGGTVDLAAGFQSGCAARIVHRPGWEGRAESDLRALGIKPDVAHGPTVHRVAPEEPGAARRLNTEEPKPQWGNPSVNGFNMLGLRQLVTRFPGAEIDDRRSASGGGGRLWVNDPMQRRDLADDLRSMGFKWANSRLAWYLPEG